jgi:pyrroloquinoline quinone (PQQ) biosynthesis protein C
MEVNNVASAGISQQDKKSILGSLPSVSHAEQVIREALNDKGGELWAKLQGSLFDMNVRLMKDGFALGTDRSEVEWKFRNLTERLEKEVCSYQQIPQSLEDPEEFLVWLKGCIAEHRVNHHSLFNYFDKDELTDEEIRYFLSNYRVNMQRFHLHVAAYSLFVPFEMREELYENLHDEFGEGNFEEAHPNLFEPLMAHFGGARREDWNPETFHLLNTKMSLCWFADGMHSGMGGMGALELSIPAQQRRVLGHLRRRGLSEDLVKFFVVHCELDEDHGDGWFAAGLPYMKTKEEFQNVYNAAMRMLEARAGVYDGILKGIENRRALQEAA